MFRRGGGGKDNFFLLPVTEIWILGIRIQ